MENVKTDDDNVALVDLDGTIADYDKSLRAEMAKLLAPGEEPPPLHGDDFPHIRAREHLIKSYPGFWRNLERLDRGFEVVEDVRNAGFRLHVLSKGPRRIPAAWAEKTAWCHEHIPDAKVTITEDKSLFYGKILIDDYPPYFEAWLKQRPRGLVIAVAQPWNDGIEHPNLIRYTGDNREEVRAAIALVRSRQPRVAVAFERK